MRKFLLALVALVGLSTAGAIANYAMTQGAGTTFGSTVVGGVHYVQMFICDLTTPAQCGSVSAAGAVKVDGSAVTQPVSGTVTANVGTGTRPISIASAQVASGAYASGSFSSGAFASGSYASGAFAAGSMVDLLTMRGTIANGTAASNAMAVGGVYNSTPLTLTNTQGSALQLDANGYLKVNTAAGAAAGGTSSNFGSAFPTPGTAVGFTDGTNMVAGRVGAVANVAAATNFLDALGICNYNATPLTVTDTRYQSIQCDVNGFLKVNVTNTNANGQAAAASSSPVVIAKNSGTGSTVAGAAVGTAGTASTEVVTVQGVASMTPFLANPGTAANWGIAATGAAVPANATYMGFNSGGNLTAPAVAAPLPVRAGDGTRQAVIDPCEANVQLYLPISITTATTTRIVTPSASNKTYICGLIAITAAANNVGIVEGTGGTCGTGTAGVIGGTTAANGPNFSANGGLALQSSKTAHAYTAGTNVDLCLITSAATPLAGGIKYVQAP